MGLFDFFKKKKNDSEVEGVLTYIPGSQTFSEDEPITMEKGELVKRLYVQPESKQATDHSNIRIFTGNPFRGINMNGMASV